MLEKIKINGKLVDAILDVPERKSNAGIFYIPGVSGGATSSRFDSLASAFRDAGYYFLRYDSWKSDRELNEGSIASVHKEFNGVVNFLKGKGCERIGIIGKSFGGGMALIYKNPFVKCMALWAPAIGISSIGNLEYWHKRKFSEISSMMEIEASEGYLREIKIPICVVHGTADDVIPFENSKKLISFIPNSMLVGIEGAGHSYRDERSESEVISKTLEFFVKSLEQ